MTRLRASEFRSIYAAYTGRGCGGLWFGLFIEKMQRAIVGFIQDEDKDWIALLECGHRQHVRHHPPWINRPWVATRQGRDEVLGKLLECSSCEIKDAQSDQH